MGNDTDNAEILAALAEHLHARREMLLIAWRESVDADPQLTTASTLSKAQFIDHIPEMLDNFERRLTVQNETQKRAVLEEQKDGAAAHGLQRWQQGYDQRQTARDWGHLQLCLLAELENFESALDERERAAMPIARRALVRLVNDGVSESASQYALMRQSEAATQVAELERALKALAAIEQQRAGIWREAAHDLRGSVGVLQSASTVLEWDNAPEAVRNQSLQVLKRGVHALHELLSDLMDLARIDAGQDGLALQNFDAAATLRNLCDTLRVVASERNLFLRVVGPSTLPVQGDRVKIVRIVQNLLLNALRYTHVGGVTLEWAAHGTQARPQWRISIIDSGPGITQTSGASIAQALEEATRGQKHAGDTASGEPHEENASSTIEDATALGHGEGIGLTIVKRLCELLDASLELDSRADGTTFRVTLPREYS